MRRIDIFVSSRKDTRKERAVAERLIRSVAAEFDLPVLASYSNWLRTPPKEERVASRKANRSQPEGAFLLCPCFREYQDWNPEDTYREHIANTGQFDLLLCLLWSRLGTKMGSAFVMPDGSEPKSATHYEIAWALDQRKRTPEFPALQVYRNRSTPAAPFEPRKEREAFFEQWNSVQECFAEWEKDTAFAGVSNEYLDLGEFEELFRNRFRDYIAARLRDERFPEEPPQRTYHWDGNPFRGLDFFDLEHARFFHGRTKIVGEVLNALQQQAAAKKPFLLVWGPGGCGKSSLVRAGLLPILTQVGTTEGDGPWRLACTRPGGGDPFDALAAALIQESALPELPEAAVRCGWKNLAAELREHPESAALRIRQTLDHLSVQALNPFLEEPVPEFCTVDTEGGAEAAQQNRLGRFRPKAQLAVVVDQLEELFVSGFSAELQQKYLAALGALVRCQRVFLIATLRSEFYVSFQKACSSDELAVLSGRFELYPPRTSEIGDIIRSPAEATGLRFEREPETGQNLDTALLEAVTGSAVPLPLLEHLLSELYRMQLVRNDGVLRWSDYRELGELESALGVHAESALLALDGEAQAALEPVIRKLAPPGHCDQFILILRPVPYHDLVSAPQLNARRKAGARRLIYRFVQEGLFHAGTDPNKEMLVSVTQESLLRNWPRVRKLLDEELELLRMRDRLEANLKRWLSQGRRSGDLLRTESGLNEAETLVRGFRTSLSHIQVDYLQKSLKARRGRRWLRNSALLAIIGGLSVLVIISTVKSLNLELRRKKAERALGVERRIANSAEQSEARAQLSERNAARATSQLDMLQARLKETEARADQAEKNAELAARQRETLQAELKGTEAKAQQAQKNAQLATSQLDALQAQLKDSEAKARKAQEYAAELLVRQRDALQARLDDANIQAEQTRKDAELTTSQRAASETQDAEAKLPQVENNSEVTATQSDAGQLQLKDADAKAQLNRNDVLANQASGPDTERKNVQEKTKSVQGNGDLRSAQPQVQDKLQQGQQAADLATTQRSTLEAQLKQAEDQLKRNQQTTDLAATERSALEDQLKQAQDQLQQAQRSADLASTQRMALEAQLREAEHNAQLAQQRADLAATQRSEMQAQLRNAEEKAQLAQKIADLVAAEEHPEENEPSKTEPPKENTDSANQLRSGRALPLDSGQNAGPEFNSIVDSTGSVRQPDALQTRQKDAEAKAQQAQTNSVKLAAGQDDSVPVQLKETEAKAQLGQKDAAPAKGQSEGVHALQTEERGPSNGGPPQNAVNSDLVPKDEPIAEVQQPAKLYRIDQSYAAVPQPTPPLSASVETTPAEVQANKTADDATHSASVKRFVLEYIHTVADDDVSTQERFFAHRVNFYGEGILSLQRLRASTDRYHREWPNRDWQPQGEPKILQSANSRQYEVLQPFTWKVFNGAQHAEGSATLYLRIWKNTKGEFHIVRVEQRNR